VNLDILRPIESFRCEGIYCFRCGVDDYLTKVTADASFPSSEEGSVTWKRLFCSRP